MRIQLRKGRLLLLVSLLSFVFDCVCAHVQTISSGSAPPPPSFWSSTVLPPQFPLLSSLLLLRLDALLPLSLPSAPLSLPSVPRKSREMLIQTVPSQTTFPANVYYIKGVMEDKDLPFLFFPWISFSELLCHFLLPAHVAYFSSLSCRGPEDGQRIVIANTIWGKNLQKRPHLTWFTGKTL